MEGLQPATFVTKKKMTSSTSFGLRSGFGQTYLATIVGCLFLDSSAGPKRYTIPCAGHHKRLDIDIRSNDAGCPSGRGAPSVRRFGIEKLQPLPFDSRGCNQQTTPPPRQAMTVWSVTNRHSLSRQCICPVYIMRGCIVIHTITALHDLCTPLRAPAPCFLLLLL